MFGTYPYGGEQRVDCNKCRGTIRRFVNAVVELDGRGKIKTIKRYLWAKEQEKKWDYKEIFKPSPPPEGEEERKERVVFLRDSFNPNWLELVGSTLRGRKHHEEVQIG